MFRAAILTLGVASLAVSAAPSAAHSPAVTQHFDLHDAVYGGPVVVASWHPGCPLCMHMLETVARLAAEHPDSDLMIVVASPNAHPWTWTGLGAWADDIRLVVDPAEHLLAELPGLDEHRVAIATHSRSGQPSITWANSYDELSAAVAALPPQPAPAYVAR